jgi:hypothetical protein
MALALALALALTLALALAAAVVIVVAMYDGWMVEGYRLGDWYSCWQAHCRLIGRPFSGGTLAERRLVDMFVGR